MRQVENPYFEFVGSFDFIQETFTCVLPLYTFCSLAAELLQMNAQFLAVTQNLC